MVIESTNLRYESQPIFRQILLEIFFGIKSGDYDGVCNRFFILYINYNLAMFTLWNHYLVKNNVNHQFSILEHY